MEEGTKKQSFLKAYFVMPFIEPLFYKGVFSFINSKQRRGEQMFTGIIEDLGKVTSIKSGKDQMELTISSKKIVEDIHLGDSIAVNGVCLTVTTFTAIHLQSM